MNGRCIIIGGRGFVGQGVVAEAQSRGLDVCVVGRDNYDTLKGAKCDLLINANGNSRKYLASQDASLDFDLSVRSVQRSLTDFVAKHYVFLSSIDVYPCVSDPTENGEETKIQPDHLSPYGFNKYIAEQLVRYHRPDALMLRMGGFVGPGLWKNPIYDMLTQSPWRVHPDSAFQYLHTRDFGRILFTLLAQGATGETINVAGDGLLSLRDIVSLIPGCSIPSQAQELDIHRYDICIDKLQHLMSVPSSRETVEAFIDDVLEDRIAIGQKETGS